MNFLRRFGDRLTGRHAPEPELRLTISNLSRDTVVARCVEVADRGAKRRKGLLGRSGLSPEEAYGSSPAKRCTPLP